jgi:streptogramin lyase
MADSQNVWFTDRGTLAIGRLPLAGGAITEISTKGADPLEISSDHLGSVVFSQAGGSSAYGSYAPSTGQLSSIALCCLRPNFTQREITADQYGTVYVAMGAPDSTDASYQGLSFFNPVSGAQGALTVNMGGAYDPASVAIDHNGNFWIADQNAGIVEELAPNNALLDVVRFSENKLTSIVEASDNNIYVADATESYIARIDEATGQRDPSFSKTTCAPAHLAADKNGNIWATEPSCNEIAQISLTGHFTGQHNDAAGPGGAPDHIAVDGNGNVWFTDSILHKIFKYTP